MNAADVLAKYSIPRELLEAAGVRHATDCEVRELLGIHGRNGQDLSGLVFPYRDPRSGRVLGHRVRLDMPQNGQKYLSTQGCRALFFTPIQDMELAAALADTSIPIVIVESEKAALALSAFASRHGRKLLVIATGGVWGWKRKSGTELQPDGARQSVSGPSPSLVCITWQDREAIIVFDSNVAGRRDLETARREFAAELSRRGAHVFIASVPARQGVNGPDDLVAVAGDAAVLKMLKRIAPFATARKPATEAPSLQAGAVLRCFADIEPQPIRWLWPERIPLGKLTLFSGDPGLGKSLVTIDIAARVTRGESFPDGAKCEVGSVIILSAEDDEADTIRPRLDAAGADVSRAHTLQAVRRAKPNGETSLEYFSLRADLVALQDAAASLGDVKLIIIDPVSAYLDGTDSHVNAKIRGLLSPLSGIASALGVAVVAVDHLSKKPGPAIYRSNGSIAFVAASRATWLFARDADDPSQRLMLPGKMNLAREQDGLSYRVQEGKPGVVAVQWGGSVSVSADIALQPERVEERSALLEAREWLRDKLSDGPVSAKQIQKDAAAAGIAWATIRRAKDALSVGHQKGSFSGGWEWVLEDAQSEDAHPPALEMSIFEEGAENKEVNHDVSHEDAHPPRVSIFDSQDDDEEVRL